MTGPIRPPMTGPAERTCGGETEFWGPLERMVMEVNCGVAKEDSCYIHTAADSAQWDRLAVQIAEIKAKGWQVVLDNGA